MVADARKASLNELSNGLSRTGNQSDLSVDGL